MPSPKLAAVPSKGDDFPDRDAVLLSVGEPVNGYGDHLQRYGSSRGSLDAGFRENTSSTGEYSPASGNSTPNSDDPMYSAHRSWRPSPPRIRRRSNPRKLKKKSQWFLLGVFSSLLTFMVIFSVLQFELLESYTTTMDVMDWDTTFQDVVTIARSHASTIAAFTSSFYLENASEVDSGRRESLIDYTLKSRLELDDAYERIWMAYDAVVAGAHVAARDVLGFAELLPEEEDALNEQEERYKSFLDSFDSDLENYAQGVSEPEWTVEGVAHYGVQKADADPHEGHDHPSEFESQQAKSNIYQKLPTERELFTDEHLADIRLRLANVSTFEAFVSNSSSADLNVARSAEAEQESTVSSSLPPESSAYVGRWKPYHVVIKLFATSAVASKRSLLSLLRTDFQGHNVTLHVHVWKFVPDWIQKEFRWKYGLMEIIDESDRLLPYTVPQWLEEWYPSLDRTLRPSLYNLTSVEDITVIPVRDDIELSRIWYTYVSNAIEAYFSKRTRGKAAQSVDKDFNPYDQVCGISLVPLRHTVMSQGMYYSGAADELVPDLLGPDVEFNFLAQNPDPFIVVPVFATGCWEHFINYWCKRNHVALQSAYQNSYRYLHIPFSPSNLFTSTYVQVLYRYTYEMGNTFLYPFIREQTYQSMVYFHDFESISVSYSVPKHPYSILKRLTVQQAEASTVLRMPKMSDLRVYDMYSAMSTDAPKFLQRLRVRGENAGSLASQSKHVLAYLPIKDINLDLFDYRELRTYFTRSESGRVYVKYFRYLRAIFPHLVLVNTAEKLKAMLTSFHDSICTAGDEEEGSGEYLYLFTTPQLSLDLQTELSSYDEDPTWWKCVRLIVSLFEGSPWLEVTIGRMRIDKGLRMPKHAYYVTHSDGLQKAASTFISQRIRGDRSSTVMLPSMHIIESSMDPYLQKVAPGGDEHELPRVAVKLDLRARVSFSDISDTRALEESVFGRLQRHTESKFEMFHLNYKQKNSTILFNDADVYVSLMTSEILDMNVVEALRQNKIVLTTDAAARALRLPEEGLVECISQADVNELQRASHVDKAIEIFLVKLDEIWSNRSKYQDRRKWIIEQAVEFSSVDSYLAGMAQALENYRLNVLTG